MKVNFSQPLKNLNGDSLKDDKDVAIPLGTVCTNALMMTIQGDKADGVEKVKRYDLATRIHSGGEVEVSVEDVALIKKMIGEGYGALVVGQAYKMLEK